ncbi:MAG: DUF523 domain-containing protein [Oscillospiraceae bacterium]|nr:DUF523 domain-containing protein [Oscillospiraceae bacterium]
MKIMVSACLLGRNCKYNGGNNLDEKVCAFVQGHEVIPVCPEELAGLGIPRVPMEIVNGVLINKEGVVVDEPVRRAVSQIVAEHPDVDLAILKSRSPTCGVKQVYDGTFSGVLVDGSGTLAQALQEAGIPTLDAEEVEKV